jgi:hypothetical protein
MPTACSAKPDPVIEHSRADLARTRPGQRQMNCKGSRKRCGDLALNSPRKIPPHSLMQAWNTRFLSPFRSIRGVAQSDIRCHTAPTTCAATVTQSIRDPAALLLPESQRSMTEYCQMDRTSGTQAHEYAQTHASRTLDIPVDRRPATALGKPRKSSRKWCGLSAARKE